jgi:hypothetical protein
MGFAVGRCALEQAQGHNLDDDGTGAAQGKAKDHTVLRLRGGEHRGASGKDWLLRNNVAVLVIVFLLLGALLTLNGVTGLLASA